MADSLSEIDGGDGYGVHTAVYLADDGVVAIDKGEIERDVVMASNGDGWKSSLCTKAARRWKIINRWSHLLICMYSVVLSSWCCRRAKNASLFSADENGPHFENGSHFENGPHLIMTVNSHIVLPRICMKYQNI